MSVSSGRLYIAKLTLERSTLKLKPANEIPTAFQLSIHFSCSKLGKGNTKISELAPLTVQMLISET